MTSQQQLFDLTRRLAQFVAPSGFEAPVQDELRTICAPYADEITSTPSGSLIIRKKGSGPRVMLSAHADTPGLLATWAEDTGYLRFSLLGSLPLPALVGARVRFQNGVEGIVHHDGRVEARDLRPYHFYVDIGASSAQEAEQSVPSGTPAVLWAETVRSGDRITSPALSGRLPCAVLADVLMNIKESSADLYIVFTTQNELGVRGARTAAFTVEPAFGVAVEMTDTGDTPDARVKSGIRLGRGPVLEILSGRMAAHPSVLSYFSGLAGDAPLQRGVRPDAQTDVMGIQLAHGGTAAGALCVPIRYRGTAVQSASLDDALALSALLTNAVQDGFSVTGTL